MNIINFAVRNTLFILIRKTMKRFIYFLTTLTLSGAGCMVMAQQNAILPPGYQVDTRIDNIGYWRQMAALGLVPVQPQIRVEPATYTGSKLLGRGITVEDSPDVPVTTESSTQSENSVFVDLADYMHILNSNNSTQWPGAGNLYGANYFHSYDAGLTWSGQLQGAGGNNQGDPVALINTSGRYFINFIDNSYGQTVAYSDNEGQSWTTSKISNGSIINILDKNHMWVDNSQTSPYEGHLYCGWMESNNIFVSRSITNGVTWESKVNISSGTAAGSHNQGINFKTGPDGEVYAAWSVYDNWPADEKAIGFAKSLDGGITWQPATRILNNIRGIRYTEVTQNQRVNSFPSMAVDISNSPYRGSIYIVWPNIGVPGINTGTGCDVYMIKSTDEGATWSTPMKINSDPTGLGKTHYFSWIACDMAYGTLSIVFYDNRNVSTSQAEAWMAWSMDGGATWEDMKVSDVSFTPSPIPGLASGYMGDYLGMDLFNGKAYPCWSDNRLGYVMTFVSPIDLIPPSAPIVYDMYILNDTTYGNGNGLMDYGETELLGLRLMNDGNMEADSVFVTLSSESPYIVFEDSTEYYGNFAVGQKKTILDAFKFSVSDSIPDNIGVIFTVKAVDVRDTVTYSNFQIFSHAPCITLISMVLNDATGNNNGILDPGENGIVKIETKNTGDYLAENVLSTLSSDNPYVSISNNTFIIGNMNPGETVFATFPVTANAAAANGSAAMLHNIATSLYHVTSRDFLLKIGLIVEDWETGGFQKFAWQFLGDANWVTDQVTKWEGTFSSRSGAIGDNQSSSLMIQYNAMYDDSITFYRKVSSQLLSDKFKFFIDGLMVGQWMGNQDWKRITFPILEGTHTFMWEYNKDAMGSSGDDCAWLDFIVFPPEYLTTVYAGPDDAICEGSAFQAEGLAVSYDSLLWSTSGTGTFDQNGILNPLYTPSGEDILVGSVTLSLTGYGMNGVDTTDSMILTINRIPIVSAGASASICSGMTFTLSEATATWYSSLQWSTTGDGIFDDPSILHPIYTPGTQDILAGMVNLVLTAMASGACPSQDDSITLNIFPVPVVNIGPDTSICAHLSYLLDATTPDAISYQWIPGGQTTPTLLVDSAGIGIGSRTFSVTVTNSHLCTGSDQATVTFKDCTSIAELEGVEVNIYPNPGNGRFTIEIRTNHLIVLDLRVIASTGTLVYLQRNLPVNGVSIHQITLDRISQGSYYLELSDGTHKLVRKILIRK